MVESIQTFAKKYGIWAALFITMLIWTINGYENREKVFEAHEQEYHKIIADNTRVMQENTKVMNDSNELMKGYKTILEIKLEQIQKDIERIGK